MKLGSVRLFERETILEGGTPYMVRWRLVDCQWFGIYVHKILRSDQQRDVHDHPFSFLSLMLWGRYCEVFSKYRRGDGFDVHLWTMTNEHRAPSVLFRRAEDAHRLLLERPCWTLVLRGPRRREWGFYTERGWVHFRDYLRGETKAENRRVIA